MLSTRKRGYNEKWFEAIEKCLSGKHRLIMKGKCGIMSLLFVIHKVHKVEEENDYE